MGCTEFAGLVLLASAASITATAGAQAAEHACHVPDQDWRVLPDCSAGADGHLRLSLETLKSLRYDPHGHAVIAVGEGFYYLTRDGRQLRVLTLDNGADWFEAGLIRGLVDGKIVYFDQTLHQAVPGRYDFAWPFDGATALACQGCTPGKPDGDGHTPMIGGHWFHVDRQGNVVEIAPAEAD